ncbi:hypothetical protein [Aurantiacibacter rhizosphaerae]|uniref:Uncharacterized protein n=1 Tax=Aurantiacibacter rhizosphaerae TaxID=2691582 RepID=A0A844X9S8_9SPHN|nr:hypothetical protein [Aurantiacibacter rhizosphaerae]MWV26539.1 hypothetical protein [Aurantiacibacter rhizosphaerae]
MASSPDHIDAMMQAPAPKAGKPPITANPAFPWIVALWFAALLGIGSLILPAALLERFVTASGLSAALPMAAPPLGFTARALVALVGTGFGALLGMALAKRLAKPRQKRITDRSAPSRKPLNPEEDFDDLYLGGEDSPAPAGRRRALAIAEEEGPSDFLNIAPVPGFSEDLGAEDVQDAAEDVAEEATPASSGPQRQEFQATEKAEEDDTLDLDPSTELVEENAGPPQVRAGRQEFVASDGPAGPVIDVEYSTPVEAKATAREPLPFSPPSMAQQGGLDRTIDGDADAPDATEEQNFAPESMSGEESEDSVSDKQIFEAADAPENAPDATTHDIGSQDNSVEDTVDQEVANQEMGAQEDGLVQLVQRLGSTLEKHREWSAERAAQKFAAAPPAFDLAIDANANVNAITGGDGAAADTPIPREFDPAAAEEAAQAMAAYFGSPAATPAEQPQPAAPQQENSPPDFSRPDNAQTADHSPQRYGALTGIAAAAVDAYDEGEDEEDDIVDLAASFALPLTKASQSAPAPEMAPATAPTPVSRPAFDQPPPSASPQVDQQVETAQTPAAAPVNPFKRSGEEFVRIEEPEPEEDSAQPAVLFPNQDNRQAGASPPRAFDRPVAHGNESAELRADRPKPSNDDNERALREALMNLQRMAK